MTPYITYFLILISLPSIFFCFYKIKKWFEKQPRKFRVKILQLIISIIIWLAGILIAFKFFPKINNTDSSSSYSVEVDDNE